MTPKFWQFHLDPINTKDLAAFTLSSIQINLAAGTLAPFTEKRPELQQLLRSIVNFDVS